LFFLIRLFIVIIHIIIIIIIYYKMSNSKGGASAPTWTLLLVTLSHSPLTNTHNSPHMMFLYRVLSLNGSLGPNNIEVYIDFSPCGQGELKSVLRIGQKCFLSHLFQHIMLQNVNSCASSNSTYPWVNK